MGDEAVLRAARDRFALERERYEHAAAEVAREVRRIAATAGIQVRTEGRAKSLDSFVKKALAKGYADPWGQTTDKAGARAIVADGSALYPLVVALEEAWAARLVGARQDKSQALDDREFDYSGVHLQMILLPADGDTEPVECEVQVRTAAQDAWSVLSHQFLYKPAVDHVPRDTRRAIYGLVALVEIFDREVGRAVTQILQDPEYPQGKLLQDAERAFHGLTHWDYNHALSRLVLGVAIHAVPEQERATYGDRLLQFVEEHAERFARFYETYGPDSELGHEPRYAVVTQPEALVLIERAEHAEMRLLDAVDNHGGADLRRLVDPLLAAWGKPLPDL